MSQIENSLNSLETQTLFSTMTKEDTNSFEQQQRYQEQQNTDNCSGEISSGNTSTELMEIPQPPTQLSSTDSTISSPPTLINSSDSNSSNSPTLSSSGSTQLDFDTPFNPISFLNTVHQKLKTSEAPVYSYSHDSATGHFYCQVNFCGQIYENKIARSKKQHAKEEAANIAVKDLSSRKPEITDLIRQYGNNKNNNQIVKQRPTTQPPELVSKSLQWYNRQLLAQAPKRPCVLLLEFCQMHRIGYPIYTMRDDGRGFYLFDCTVYNRIFKAELGFWKKNDAKDHISFIAFEYLYREFFEKEQREIQISYGMPPIAPIAPPIPSPPPPHPPNIAFSPVYSNVPNVIDRNNYGYFC